VPVTVKVVFLPTMEVSDEEADRVMSAVYSREKDGTAALFFWGPERVTAAAIGSPWTEEEQAAVLDDLRRRCFEDAHGPGVWGRIRQE